MLAIDCFNSFLAPKSQHAIDDALTLAFESRKGKLVQNHHSKSLSTHKKVTNQPNFVLNKSRGRAVGPARTARRRGGRGCPGARGSGGAGSRTRGRVGVGRAVRWSVGEVVRGGRSAGVFGASGVCRVGAEGSSWPKDGRAAKARRGSGLAGVGSWRPGSVATGLVMVRAHLAVSSMHLRRKLSAMKREGP